MTSGIFTLSIHNSFDGKLHQTDDQQFCSLKHDGPEIGISSVKSIVEKYKGSIRFEHNHSTFSVYVVLFSDTIITNLHYCS